MTAPRPLLTLLHDLMMYDSTALIPHLCPLQHKPCTLYGSRLISFVCILLPQCSGVQNRHVYHYQHFLFFNYQIWREGCLC